MGLRPHACWDFGFETRLDMHVFLLWMFYVVRQMFLCWADHSSRGVLPTVVCRVWSINLKNVEAMAYFEPQHHWKKRHLFFNLLTKQQQHNNNNNNNNNVLLCLFLCHCAHVVAATLCTCCSASVWNTGQLIFMLILRKQAETFLSLSTPSVHVSLSVVTMTLKAYIHSELCSN